MVINLENKEEFEDLDLHDAELLDIHCDYRNQTVFIKVRLNVPREKSQVLNLIFREFSFFLISCTEPWGSGIYILGAFIDETDEEGEDLFRVDGKIFVKITLNSGDNIKIVASSVECFLE